MVAPDYTGRDANYDSLYEGEYLSPANTGVVDVGGAVYEQETQQRSPFDTSNPIPAAYVPRPPDPALEGKPGMTHALGFTKGLRTARSLTQRFGGKTLVVSSMGVHPVQGPVGYSTRTDRLLYGVSSLDREDMPSNTAVAEQFAMLGTEALPFERNPNYG